MVKMKENMIGWKMWEHGVQNSRLTVIAQVEDYVRSNGMHEAQLLCECNCGKHNQIIVRRDALKSGQVKSCGCLAVAAGIKRCKKKIKYNVDSNEPIWTVYVHTNTINNKRYVGITSKKPEERWGNGGSGYRKNMHFWSSIQKYGWDNFEHEIINSKLTHDEACKIEKDLIKRYQSNNNRYGYNLTDGGEGISGYKISEETKEKLRQANLGKSLTEETRKKISQKLKGYKKSEAEKEAISKRMSLKIGELNNMYGKHHSEETKRKMSESISNAMQNKEVREKIGKANRGINHGRIVPLYCPELNQCFWGGKDVFNQYGIRHVLEVRNKADKTAGKHPDTGEPLHWQDATTNNYVMQLIHTLNKIIITKD